LATSLEDELQARLGRRKAIALFNDIPEALGALGLEPSSAHPNERALRESTDYHESFATRSIARECP
jgi:hypothetical protein